MRELLQDKTLQVEDLTTKFERHRCEAETIHQKLLKENEILRLRIS